MTTTTIEKTAKIKPEDYFTHAHYWCYASEEKEAMINVARLLIASFYDKASPGPDKLFEYVSSFADFAKNGSIFTEESKFYWISFASENYALEAISRKDTIKVTELGDGYVELGSQEFDLALDTRIEQHLVKGMF